MSNENELAKSNDTNALAEIAAIAGNMQKYDDSQFETVAKSADYLCRLQLCGSASKLFKKNKIAKGNYAYIITSDDFKDLGSSVDVLPISWRPKALDMSGDTPMSFYDVNSTGFKEICAKSMQANSNCTYGPEYLVWVPAIKKFATLHYGSKTSRKDAKDMHQLLQKGATLTHRIVENDKGIWESIVTSPCSTPFEMPPLDATRDAVEKFMTEATQKAPEKATPASGRAR